MAQLMEFRNGYENLGQGDGGTCVTITPASNEESTVLTLPMSELHPPSPPLPLPSTTTSPPPPPIQLLPTNTNSQTLAPKRQRRPSVRLGDIGGEPSLDHSNFRRPKTSWNYHKYPSVALKTSKTRPLTNLVNKDPSFFDRFSYHGESSDRNVEYLDKKPKLKKPVKRARTNWAGSSSKFEIGNVSLNGGLGVSGFESDLGFRDGNGDNENDLREFEMEGDESPLRLQQQSPVNSRESLEFRDRRNTSGVRVSESSGGHHEINGTEQNNGDEFRSSSVKDWLTGLGLGQYAPNFEIHEVGDEVLPMLTMEDLKDMGINAVGSRRKMYTALEKLRKEFL